MWFGGVVPYRVPLYTYSIPILRICLNIPKRYPYYSSIIDIRTWILMKIRINCSLISINNRISTFKHELVGWHAQPQSHYTHHQIISKYQCEMWIKIYSKCVSLHHSFRFSAWRRPVGKIAHQYIWPSRTIHCYGVTVWHHINCCACKIMFQCHRLLLSRHNTMVPLFLMTNMHAIQPCIAVWLIHIENSGCLISIH